MRAELPHVLGVLFRLSRGVHHGVRGDEFAKVREYPLLAQYGNKSDMLPYVSTVIIVLFFFNLPAPPHPRMMCMTSFRILYLLLTPTAPGAWKAGFC